MTKDQKKLIDTFGDQKYLIEICIAFAQTPNAKLGSYARRDLDKIASNLNFGHLDCYIIET